MKKLWVDLKTDTEKIEFLRSGRAWESGIIAQAFVEDVASAFEERIFFRKMMNIYILALKSILDIGVCEKDSVEAATKMTTLAEKALRT